MTYASNLSKSKKIELAKKFKRQIFDYNHEGLQKFEHFLDDLFSGSDIYDNNFIQMIETLVLIDLDFPKFCEEMKKYNFSAICGLVWTANYVAYRCKDCAISPCMSICPDCFKGGPHEKENHDYNMFRSQAGGACDCGDPNVMKISGFCQCHGINNIDHWPSPPKDMTIMLSLMSPYLVSKILLFFREYAQTNGEFNLDNDLPLCYNYVELLSKYLNVASPIKKIIAKSLIDNSIYDDFIKDVNSKAISNNSEDETNKGQSSKLRTLMQELRPKYVQACHKIGTDPESLQMCQFIDVRDKATFNFFAHKNVLDELMMWIFLTELPQTIVTFVLQTLNVTIPDVDFKTLFCESFVKHYACLPRVLMRCTEPDVISSRLFHISVQLFSNEVLSYEMVTGPGKLLRILINSLNLLILPILISQTSNEGDGNSRNKNLHVSVNCANKIMQSHSYWPIVSDFVTLLTHSSVSKYFLTSDVQLITLWTHVLYSFQGMNINKKEKGLHIEYEPWTYYVAFSSEIEVCISILQALLSHLKEGKPRGDAVITKVCFDDFRCLLTFVMLGLQDWFEVIGLTEHEILSSEEVSFHLPLHRYLSSILSAGMRKGNLNGKDLIHIFSSVHPFQPVQHFLKLLMKHPLRIQVVMNEIMAGLWVRNGMQIKGQVMTYTQHSFTDAMSYPDIFILQICACFMHYDDFIQILMSGFGIEATRPLWKMMDNKDVKFRMLEGCLTLILFLVNFKDLYTPGDDYTLHKNLAELLCQTNHTAAPVVYSQLIEMIPDRTVYSLDTSSKTTDHSSQFFQFIEKFAEFKPPDLEMRGGEINQGSYVPKDTLWDSLMYDPLRILVNDATRKNFQISMDNYKNFLKKNYPNLPAKVVDAIWPPYDVPKLDKGNIFGVMLPLIVHSEKLNILLTNILITYLVNVNEMPENLLQLALYVIELKIRIAPTTDAHFHEMEKENLTINMKFRETHHIPTPNNVLGNEPCKSSPSLSSPLLSNNLNKKRCLSQPSYLIDVIASSSTSSDLKDLSELQELPSLLSLTKFRYTPTKLKESLFQDYSEALGIFTDPKPKSKHLESSVADKITVAAMDNTTKSRSSFLDKLSHHLGTSSFLRTLNTSTSNKSCFNDEDAACVPEQISKLLQEVSLYACLRLVRDKLAECTSYSLNSDPGMASIPTISASLIENKRIFDGKSYSNFLVMKLDALNRDSSGESFGKTESINDKFPLIDSFCTPPALPNLISTTNASSASCKQKLCLSENIDEQHNTSNIKKKMAKDRQRKLMNAYASKQKKFMHHMTKNKELYPDSRLDEKSSEKVPKKNDVCSICGMTVDLKEHKADEILGIVCHVSVFNGINKLLFAGTNGYPVPSINDMSNILSYNTSPSNLSNTQSNIESDCSNQSGSAVKINISNQNQSDSPGATAQSVVTNQKNFFLNEIEEEAASETSNPKNECDFMNYGKNCSQYISHVLKFSGIPSKKWVRLITNKPEVPFKHVTTCGHILHLPCYQSYIDSLQNQNTGINLLVKTNFGEFQCPVCRNISNSCIPLKQTNLETSHLDGGSFDIKNILAPDKLIFSELNLATHSETMKKFDKLLQKPVQTAGKLNSTGFGLAFINDMPNDRWGPSKEEPTGGEKTEESQVAKVVKKFNADRMIDNMLDPHCDIQNCSTILRYNVEMLLSHCDTFKRDKGGDRYNMNFHQTLFTGALINRLRCIFHDSIEEFKSFYAISFNNGDDNFTYLRDYFMDYQMFCQILFLNPDSSIPDNLTEDMETLYSNVLVLCDPFALLTSLIVMNGTKQFYKFASKIFLVYLFQLHTPHTGNNKWDNASSSYERPINEAIYDDDAFKDLKNLITKMLRPFKTESNNVYRLNSYLLKGLNYYLKFCYILLQARNAFKTHHQHLHQANLPPPAPPIIKMEMEMNERDVENGFWFTKLTKITKILEYIDNDSDNFLRVLQNTFLSSMNLTGKTTNQPNYGKTNDKLVKIVNYNSTFALFHNFLHDNDVADFGEGPSTSFSKAVRISSERRCLLNLPELYETLFSSYYGKKCLNCDMVPTDPGVCLVCGTLVCIKDSCCSNKDNTFEAVSHAQVCGSGVAVYQVINTGSVLIISNHRACIWASLYLDIHGEEDKDLKRGKPLYLCKERAEYLENLYVTDTILEKIKRWTWHFNIL